MQNRGIIWFRSDLRIHDNEAIWEASNCVNDLLYVYVFDERVFHEKTSFGFPKTGKFRARFIIDAVKDLRNSIQQKGASLIVRVGKPEKILFEIARESKASWVFCNRERTQEEVKVQDQLEKNLWSIGREVRYSRGKMLFYTADLPFPINHTPDTFSNFRREVERFVSIREPLQTANGKLLSSEFEISKGDIPNLTQLGYLEENDFEIEIQGGESFALRELDKFASLEEGGIESVKESRYALSGAGISSKMSGYLAHGCISPKLIYHVVRNLETRRNKKSIHFFMQNLMYRDFLRLMGKKHGRKIFDRKGFLDQINGFANNDLELFQMWALGQTGIPIVDANMKELNATGLLSGMGRNLVARFLVRELGLNWVLGAEYFESQLIDYDPCSNYGNWNIIASGETDKFGNLEYHFFDISKRLDPKGNYIRKWVKELSSCPKEFIHNPFEHDFEDIKEFGITKNSVYAKNSIDFVN